MAEDKIDSYVDRAGVQADTDFLLSLLAEVDKQFNKLNSFSISLQGMSKTKEIAATTKEAGAAMEELATKLEEVKKADDDLVKSAKDFISVNSQFEKSNRTVSGSYKELLEQLSKNQLEQKKMRDTRAFLNQQLKDEIITMDKYIEEMSKVNDVENQLRVSNGDLTRSLRNLEKEAQSAEGSLNEMRAQLNLNLQAFDRLSAMEQSSDSGKAIKANIDSLTASITEQEQATGRFQRNVGNYASGVERPFALLQERLNEVTEDLQKLARTGDSSSKTFSDLAKEQGILQQILDKNSNGFATMQQEIKANEAALQKLAAIGMKNTEAYTSLFDATASLKDEFSDLKEELKFSSDNQSGVDKFANSIKQLAAIYQVAEGAAALFGTENEELQKTMVRLMAVQNIANGIFELQEELKRKNSIVSALYNFVMTGSIKANTQAATATKVNNLATREQTGSTVAATTATTGLTIATRVLRAALLATGIGALVIGISLLISKISEWTNADDMAIEKQKELSEAMSEVLAAQKAQADAFKEGAEKNIKLIQDRIALEKAAGNTQVEQFAGEVAIQKERQKLAEAQIKTYQITQEKTDKFFENYSNGLETIKQQEIEYYKLVKAGREDDAEDLKKLIDNNKSATANQKAAYDLRAGILKDYNDSVQQQNLLAAQQAKFSADEQRKYILESAKIQSDLVIDSNSRILADEKSTLTQRLAALKSTSAERVKLIIAERDAVLNDPTASSSTKQSARNKANAEELKAARELADKEADIRRQYAEKQRKADFDLRKQQLDDQLSAQDRIAESEKESFVDRVTAAGEYFELQKQLIAEQAEFELAATGLLETDKQRIRERARSEEEAANRQFLDRIYQLQLKALDRESRETIGHSNEQRDTRLKEAAEAYAADEISYEEYLKRKQRIENRYALDELKITLESLEKQLVAEKAYGDAVIEIRKQIAAVKKEIAEKEADDKKDATDKETDEETQKMQRIQEISDNATSAIFTALQISGDRELARIDEAVAELEKKKAKEIELADATIANEQEKAAAIAVIEAKAAVQREVLERRRRQVELEQARFQKYDNIAKIISGTSLAVVNTLADETIKPSFLKIPLALSIGLLGAAQLARAVAVPLPKYAEGTDDHPGGKAILGDANKSELVITPEGKMMITDKVPHILDLPQHSVVLPDANEALDHLFNVGYRTMGRQHAPVDEDVNRALLKAYNRGTKQIVQTIKGKKEYHFEGTHAGVIELHKWGQNHIEYVDKSINF